LWSVDFYSLLLDAWIFGKARFQLKQYKNIVGYETVIQGPKIMKSRDWSLMLNRETPKTAAQSDRSMKTQHLKDPKEHVVQMVC
jgi:hypothetical protein